MKKQERMNPNCGSAYFVAGKIATKRTKLQNVLLKYQIINRIINQVIKVLFIQFQLTYVYPLVEIFSAELTAWWELVRFYIHVHVSESEIFPSFSLSLV